MKKIALALLVLVLPVPASAHLELELLTPDGELYPGCEVEPTSRPPECPYRLQIQGWDVYISSLILTDEYSLHASRYGGNPHGEVLDSALDTLLDYLQDLELQFRLLEHTPLPLEFARTLRQKGVTFYISPWIEKPEERAVYQVNPDDKYYICSNSGARYCYSGHSRQIQLTLPTNHNDLVIETLVHELAHAWHDLVVPNGFANQCVIDAYEFSVVRDQLYSDFQYRSLSGNYPDGVIEGMSGSTYAATNHLEYFAELVTVYFMQDAFTPGSGHVRPFSSRSGIYDLDRNGYWMVTKLVYYPGIFILFPVLKIAIRMHL